MATYSLWAKDASLPKPDVPIRLETGTIKACAAAYRLRVSLRRNPYTDFRIAVFGTGWAAGSPAHEIVRSSGRRR